jgi:N4-gp56 family major capsid protein
MDDVLPKASGKTVQWFRYTNLASSTTPTVEGTIGSSQAITSKIVSATISQYTSFITVSDLLDETSLDPMVVSSTELLGYQGGLTVDTITRTVIDNEFANCTLTAQGTYLKVADLRNARTQLQAVDVEPMADGNFLAIAHPFSTYDIVNDPAAGGLADIRKYTNPAVLNTYQDRGEITVVAGCKLIESTNVKVVAGSPNTYAMYVFGKNAVGAVDLEGRGPNKVVDPSKQRFAVKVIRGGNNIADPEGVIGAAVSYNFKYTCVVLEGPTGIGGVYRMKQFRCQSSVG